MKIYLIQEPFGIDNLKIAERPTPELSSTQVLIKVRAVSLNYRDLLVVKGIGGWRPPVARIPVSDAVGIITAVGAGVSKFKIGDRVTGLFLPLWDDGELSPEKILYPLGGATTDGVLAEYIALDETAIIAVPDFLTDEEAATLPCAALTAWHAVAERGNIAANQVVLVQGTGGVSLFAMQVAQTFGAKVIVTSSSNDKLHRVANEFGVFATINYREEPDWDKKVLETTEGKGVDRIIEVVGGENLNRSLNAIKMSGAISIVGLLGGLEASFNVYGTVAKNVNIYGIEVGSREMFARMNQQLVTHSVKPIVDRVFAFDEVRQALSYLETGNHFGKIVVRL